jgi:hypothetical protein
MTSVLALILALSSSSAFAMPLSDEYLTLGKIVVTEVPVEKSSEPLSANAIAMGAEECRSLLLANNQEGVIDSLESLVNPLKETEVILDQLINIGKKVLKVVEAGKPQVKFTSQLATALPEGSKCWLQLQNWQVPEAKAYRIQYKNLYGLTVVDFTYRITYLYGGGVEGLGKYIGYAKIEKQNLDVKWGWSFEANATVPTVFNTGTRANPVAGMNLLLEWKVSTLMNENIQTNEYFIGGNGLFKALQ